jgi:hypothetical protein
VSSSAGRSDFFQGMYRSLPTASKSGCTPEASTACTLEIPGSTVGITGPVSSCTSQPKSVSSCGGRPTTVTGQIAPSRCQT